MDLSEILSKVSNGKLSPRDAEKLIKLNSIQEVSDFAKIDTGRSLRKGVPEIILAEGKTSKQILEIATKMIKHSDRIIISRIDSDQYKYVKNRIKNHRIIYNEVGNILVLSTKTQKKKSTHGKVAIITAGTADVSVAEEAKTFLESVYVNVITHYDVGVAGIHRLFNSISYVIDEDVDVIIAIAGREGAMPSIIAGLVDKPIIGVPTSNGYGYGEKGISALTSMLQSCSLGIGTVNIDSGIGAAVFAYLICNSLHR